MGGERPVPPPFVPDGLSAERFEVDGVEFVAFAWESTAAPVALSASERAVCELVVAGASNAAIARARQTSVRTVANQVASILKKVGVASRFELIARFAGVGAR